MKALERVVVLDLTRAIAGPYCTMYLGDLGAKVIKVENPDDPDFIRTYFPKVGKDENEFSAPFAQYNRNKSSITLNLGKPEGQLLFKEMVEKADIVVENYKPGVMKKFGLDYEVLKKINPKIIYAAITGFGQDGPYSKRPAFDTCAQAIGGIWSVNGYKNQPPVKVGTILSDLVAGLNGVIGILAAYSYMQKTGIGQMVDAAMLDSTLAITGYAVPRYAITKEIPGPIGNYDTNARPFEDFNTKDGVVFFGGFTDKFFNLTCDWFGHSDFYLDPEIDTMEKRFNDEVYFRKVRPALESWFAEYTTKEVVDGLASIAPLAPVNNIGQAVADPQILHREMMVKYSYPGGSMELFGSPIKLSETPTDPTGLAPNVGQHNDEIYLNTFGFDEERIDLLKNNGTI